MEVQKHPHNVTHKKKWLEYLLEFIMIFFAVTLGFFAENMREHLSDKKLERQYISSLLEDLRSDTAQLQNYIDIKKQKVALLDSLIYLFTSEAYKNNLNEVYYAGRIATRTTRFYSNDRTTEQLKNTGGERFIKNNKVSDRIIAYKAKIRELVWNEDVEYQNFQNYRDVAGEVFNVSVFQKMTDNDSAIVIRPDNNPPLLNNDKMLINKIAYKVYYLNAVDKLLINYAKNLKTNATDLIGLIHLEYRE